MKIQKAGFCLPKIPHWRGRDGSLVDRAANSGPCVPSSIPLGEKQKNKRKEAGVGPFLKKITELFSSERLHIVDAVAVAQVLINEHTLMKNRDYHSRSI